MLWERGNWIICVQRGFSVSFRACFTLRFPFASMLFATNGCVRFAMSDRICALSVKLDCGG